MIRDTQKEVDLIEIVVALLGAFAGSGPLSACDIVRGWPTTLVRENKTKGLVYIGDPLRTPYMGCQGASKTLDNFSMTVGIFEDRESGGEQAATLVASWILGTMNDPATIEAKKFTVTLDKAYANTNLEAMGVEIFEAIGPTPAYVDQPDHWRKEIELHIIA